MLCYKAWRETRTRFAIIAATITGFCLFAVLFRHNTQENGISVFRFFRTSDYSQNIYNIIYSGTAKGMFAILTIFLGLGGLLRERRHRTAIFTLALPVSRLQIVLAQIGVGLSELVLLALLPALLIPSLSKLVHQSYPLAEALHFSVLWFACGSIIFAAAFLMSVVLDGEYTAPVVCYVALMLQALIGNWPALRPYRLNMMWTMGEFGTMHWDAQHNFLLSGPLPWARLLVIMLMAMGMLVLAAQITARQDF